MEENNYKEFFEKELKILRNKLPDGDELIIEPYIKAVNNITDIFSNQGHSGMSAPFTSITVSNTIKNILSFKPLSPITGDDNEWVDVTKEFYQNNRCSAVFKDKKTGIGNYLDAIVWNGEDEYDTFSGVVEGISSEQNIEFPFTPKTFYIDVVKDYKFGDEENPVIDKDNSKYVYRIKDKRQLEEVFKYYNR